MVGIPLQIAAVGALALGALYAIRRFDLLGQFGSAGEATVDFGGQVARGLGESGQGLLEFGNLFSTGVGQSGQGFADFLSSIRNSLFPLQTMQNNSGSDFASQFSEGFGDLAKYVRDLVGGGDTQDMPMQDMPTQDDNLLNSINDGVGDLYDYLRENAQNLLGGNDNPMTQTRIVSGELQNYPMPQTPVVSGELNDYPMRPASEPMLPPGFVGENDEYSGFFGQ